MGGEIKCTEGRGETAPGSGEKDSTSSSTTTAPIVKITTPSSSANEASNVQQTEARDILEAEAAEAAEAALLSQSSEHSDDSSTKQATPPPPVVGETPCQSGESEDDASVRLLTSTPNDKEKISELFVKQEILVANCCKGPGTAGSSNSGCCSATTHGPKPEHIATATSSSLVSPVPLEKSDIGPTTKHEESSSAESSAIASTRTPSVQLTAAIPGPAEPPMPAVEKVDAASSTDHKSNPPSDALSGKKQKNSNNKRTFTVVPSQCTRTMGSSLFPRPCLSHAPTLEELRSCSFSDFVREVVLEKAMPEFEGSEDEDDFEDHDWCKTAMPLTEGIAKVTLPEGFWQEEGIGKDRTGRGPKWQKGEPLGDLKLESPITQHIRGMAGVYEYTFTDNPAISIADFRKKADRYRDGQVGVPFDDDDEGEETKERDDADEREKAEDSKRNSKSDSDGEKTKARPKSSIDRIVQLDRHFWKRLGPTMPAAWYGADQEGTLFGDDPASGWSLGELDSCLHVLSRVPGVTTPYLYAGMWASVFCAHTEDMNLLSINYLHAGAPKVWYAVAPGPDAKRFEALCEFQYSIAARGCKEFMRHKRYLLSPMVLQKAGIKYTTCIQRPGDAVITFPGGYHFGFNTGFNLAEATNFGVPEWIPYGLQAGVCMCRPDSVRIDMNKLISLLDMYESEKARKRSLSWKGWSQKREQKKQRTQEKQQGQRRMMATVVCKAVQSTSPTTAKAKPKKKQKRLSDQEKKNEFWIEVVKPAPKKAPPKEPKVEVEEEVGRGKRKRKKTLRAALWEAESKKDQAKDPTEEAAPEIWRLARPIPAKRVPELLNARVLCLLPGTVVMGAKPKDILEEYGFSTERREDDDDDDEDEQCFAGVVVGVADQYVRVRLDGLPAKSEEVWVPAASASDDSPSKIFLDGGLWEEEHDQFGIPKRHYWKEMDSKHLCGNG